MTRVIFTVLLLFSAPGCAGEGERPERLGVYAASSLTDAFRELEVMFEEAYPDTDVLLTFAGSQMLRIQIEEGAPADIFASANPDHIDALRAADLVQAVRPFASNEMVVIVPLDNPAGIERFADLILARRVVLGSRHVPAGRYAREVLERSGDRLGAGFRDTVFARVVSEETNVRLARSRVELGEADAAIVYRTDGLRSNRVRIVTIPEEVGVRARYSAGLVASSSRPDAGERWLDFLTSPSAQAILARDGFGPPEEKSDG